MLVDMLMDYDDAVEIVKNLGWGAWYKHIAELFPKQKLYSASTDWFNRGSDYIAKFKGANGDVIVGWKHDH